MAGAGRDLQARRPLVCKLSEQGEQAGKARELDFSVAAVLPAGGSGERMGSATPKQFCQLLQRPLISLTLEAFERVHWIKEIVVVVSQQNFELMNAVIGQYGHSRATVVVGGLTRHQSIFNGLKAFVENEPHQSWLEKPEVVIIHDAVRPFVEEDILYRVATAAKEHGAAGAIRPLVSTVVATNPEGYLDHSLERAKYRASEMPQAFTFDVIYRAYEQCTDYDFEHGTECLHLALQYCGISAKLFDGPPDLWKVTYKRDLYAAESIVKESLSKSVCIITGMQEEPIQLGILLQEVLQLVIKQVNLLKWSLSKESHCIQAISSGLHYNFIYINVNNFKILQEIVQLVEAIENVKLSALYPVAVTVVHLNNTEASSSCIQMNDFTNIKKLAKEANGKNILIYNLLINYTQSKDKVQESVKQGASIIESLIKQRSPALTGQFLVKAEKIEHGDKSQRDPRCARDERKELEPP
ncbi:D-ribitol-5-phosphate cytidylyltransferase [Pristis pectinata]|uniref:D-ribitol-5-phosphate cytidylyltransferase n=1 Tax=Pristis pectinata TaxID=685728 RepID=UPI00223E6C14|nr:D-ribitol-5-phosphate cytidylyltransferase [Pristis pectinata]